MRTENNIIDLSSQTESNSSCNLCLECNPDCSNCENMLCPDDQRICSNCTNCQYMNVDDLNKNILQFRSSHGSKNSISFLHANIVSLEKNLSKITDLLLNLNHPIDLICISETKLKDSSNLNKIQIDGYKFKFTHSPLAFGGAGIYLSDHLTIFRRKDLEFDTDDGCESCFVEIKTEKNQKNMIVGTVYRHPHDDNLDAFFQKLIEVVQKCSKYSLMITGDMNINTDKNNQTNTSKHYQDILLSLGLVNLISKPTRITESSETIIDHILTNMPLQKVKCGVVTHDISDHLPTFAICNSTFIKAPSQPKPFYRPICDRKKGKFLEMFQTSFSTVTNAITAESDPDEDLIKLVSYIDEMSFNVFPVCKRSKKQTKLYRKPWMTKGILTSIKKRNELKCSWLKTRDEETHLK